VKAVEMQKAALESFAAAAAPQDKKP